MTNKDYYFLSKLAKAEKTIKQATVTTCTHKALTPTEPVAPTLGESDKIMYGQGSVAKTAAGIDPKSGDMGGSFSDAIMNQAYMTNPITGIPNAIGGGYLEHLVPPVVSRHAEVLFPLSPGCQDLV